jgi:hypothetical protein
MNPPELSKMYVDSRGRLCTYHEGLGIKRIFHSVRVNPYNQIGLFFVSERQNHKP